MDNNRYSVEYRTLQKYFPRKFVFMNRNTSSEYVDVGIQTNSKKTYRLKIITGNSFPNSHPRVYVTYPSHYSLVDYEGNHLKSRGASSRMHTLSPNEDNNVQICHYDSSNWRPTVTLYKVIIKCRLWLEAYEGHLRTGEPIDYFLSHA